MKITIIIATYQRRFMLERTFPTVLAQTGVSDLEFVIVVDGSTDGTADFLRSLRDPRIKIVEQGNAGPGAARNAGAAIATGELLLFLDDDIICPPRLAQAHAAVYRSGDRKVLCGAVLISDESPSNPFTELARRQTTSGYDRHRAAGKLEFPLSTLVDANSSLSRNLFREFGGFDPSYRRSETNELGFRLHAGGVPFEFVPEATAWQIFQKTAKQSFADAAWHGCAEWRLARQFPEYRAYCALNTLGEGSASKRRLRATVTSLPTGCWAPLTVLEHLPKGLGLKSVELRRAAAVWRSAAREGGGWKELNRRFGMRLPVLLYHHVGPCNPQSAIGLNVSAAMFEKQMRWLKHHGYSTISTSDWLDWVSGKRLLPEKPVLLTFDDALAALAVHAFPVLQRMCMKAVCYVVTGKLGGWNDWAGIQTGHDRLMTQEQLKEWAAQGVEFGAHTRTHPDLRTLQGTELEDEIVGSRRDLEQILGAPINSFAYTYGFYNHEVVACVRRSFACSFTTEEGMNVLNTDPHLLRRTMVTPWDWPIDLRLRLGRGYSPIINLRSKMRLRTRLRRMAGARQ